MALLIKSRYYLVSVKDAYNTYTTSTINGHKASSTSGPRQAVERLGAKIYGDQVSLRIEEEAGNGNHLLSLYRLYIPEAN